MEFDVKKKVQEYYGSIARKVDHSSKSSCCCSSSCCGDTGSLSSDYSMEELKELPVEAVNASLGCSNPISIAELKNGETALDLGSGGGIDVFIASKYVGSTGKVYGLDMTDDMLALANRNKKKMGAGNVEFIKGYIEEIPLEDKTIDVIISNCVINLSENKSKVLSEAYRVLREGGRLAVSDIVNLKDVTPEIRKMAEAWVGCIAGSINIEEYKRLLEKAGFRDITVEPVNIYSKSFIKELLGQKNYFSGMISDADLDAVDGAFAGANIKAYK